MTLTDRQKEFFTRLGALCAEFDAKIGGCGCCDSPYVLLCDDGDFARVGVERDGRVDLDGKYTIPGRLEPEEAAALRRKP